MAVDGSTTNVNGTTESAIGGVGNCNQGNGITATIPTGQAIGQRHKFQCRAFPYHPCRTRYRLPNNQTLHGSQTLSPGSYGNINTTGNATITLPWRNPGNPAVYTLNSFSLSSGATLVINGPVVINLAGTGQNNVLSLNGRFSNTTNIPGNFQINYGGTGNINVSGGPQAYAVIDAPNASISFSGGSNFYGQAIGNSISDTGGTSIYCDSSLNSPTINNNSFYEISLRELSY